MDALTLLRRQYYALCPAYLLQLPDSSTLASERGHETLLSLLDDDPPRPEDGYARQFWKRVLPVLERGVMNGEGVEEVDERIYQAVTDLAVGAVDSGAPAQSYKTFLYSPSTSADRRAGAPLEQIDEPSEQIDGRSDQVSGPAEQVAGLSEQNDRLSDNINSAQAETKLPDSRNASADNDQRRIYAASTVNDASVESEEQRSSTAASASAHPMPSAAEGGMRQTAASGSGQDVAASSTASAAFAPSSTASASAEDAPPSATTARSTILGAMDPAQIAGSSAATAQPSDTTAPSAASERRITLLEEQVAVSSGSTGLRTWTASLHLGHHLLNGSITLSRDVLELGAGTGFLSILLTQLGHDVIATDLGDSLECPHDTAERQTPLGRLRANFALNGISESKAQALDWADASRTPRPEIWDQAKGRDIVAADVIYDPDIVPLLVAAQDALITRQGVLAATVRNEETFQLFLAHCASTGLKTELLDLEPMDRANPTFWDTALDLGSRVEVVRITRSSS